MWNARFVLRRNYADDLSGAENIKGCYEVITDGFVEHGGCAVNDDAGTPVLFATEELCN